MQYQGRRSASFWPLGWASGSSSAHYSVGNTRSVAWVPHWPWVGVYFGNRKAHEVDKYREELIRGRERPPESDEQAG